jgi:DNA-binding NtrC family response regulator
MMTTSDMIDVQDLPPHLQTPAVSVRASEVDVLEGQERLLIVQALETAGGNQTEAARILSISRDRLRYKLKKHNLYQPDSGSASAAAG